MSGQMRQLAAIMFTDIVGYTALMGRDEQRAFELLKKNREIHRPLIKQFHGTWIKELGDGVLASFHTVTDAVFCAAAIHRACNTVDGLQLRIGIHLGEVIFENNDVFGDGVNIASRLQAMASPGCTWVSEVVYKNLANKKEINSEFIKEEQLKNVSEPVKVYEIYVKEIPGYLQDNPNAEKQPGSSDAPIKSKKILIAVLIGLVVLVAIYLIFFDNSSYKAAANLKTTEKSIAVIPFRNLSEEKENQHFADGMMDEILNKLSKIRDLKVISRTSVEQYRDTKKSIREIAKELGVSYILEGSAQKYGDQIKVNAQLIHAETDGHMWSDNYTKTYKEVFTLQSEIANSIANQLQAKLTPRETALVNKTATANTEAYDFYLRGVEYITSYTLYNKAIDLDRAKAMFHKALQIDSSFAQTWVGLADEYWVRNFFAPEYLSENYLDSVLYYSNRALSLDADLADAYEIRGRYYNNRGNTDKAISDAEKAISIDPNHANAFWSLGWFYYGKRDYIKSLMNFKKARDLIRGGSGLPGLLANTAGIHNAIGNFQEAESLLEKSIQLNPEIRSGYYGSYSRTLTLQGKLDKALAFARKAVEFDPESYSALDGLSNAYAFLKDFKNALHFLELAEEKRKMAGAIRITDVHWVGYILWNTGRKEEAFKYFNDQIKTHKEAMRLRRFEIANFNYDLAATYAFLKEDKKAIHYLKECEKEGFTFGNEYLIMVDPLFDSLRTNSEFKEIVSRAQVKKAEIRKQIKDLEAKGEL